MSAAGPSKAKLRRRERILANQVLTEPRRRVLESARGPNQVISMPDLAGFDIVNWRRAIAWLLARGMIAANARGGYRRLPAGTAAIASADATTRP